jgi:hypothetical protein
MEKEGLMRICEEIDTEEKERRGEDKCVCVCAL